MKKKKKKKKLFLFSFLRMAGHACCLMCAAAAAAVFFLRGPEEDGFQVRGSHPHRTRTPPGGRWASRAEAKQNPKEGGERFFFCLSLSLALYTTASPRRAGRSRMSVRVTRPLCVVCGAVRKTFAILD